MIKKVISSFLVLMMSLTIVMPSAAEAVTDELKTGYALRDDSNLIDKYPEYSVDINSGEVPCSVSGKIVKLAPNATVPANSDWGISGFHINYRFISSIPQQNNYSPEFAQGTRVLFSAKVRKTVDATENAKINVALSSWYDVAYENGKSFFADGYPEASDGFVVNSTEWTDFVAVITVPKNCGGNTWNMTVGLAKGTALGANVEIDMSSMYFGPEVEINPEELVDYTPADSDNMVDKYPEYSVDINSGEVPCSVSGNTVKLAPNSVVPANGDWGLCGFHVNQRFISSIPQENNYAPEFTQGTKVLFSAKVRKASDATADAKINVALSSWYFVAYENGAPLFADMYPSVTDGFLVDSTEWTDFKAVITVPRNCGGNTWNMTVGLAKGTALGANVEVDMSSIFFGEEKLHNIVLNCDGNSVVERGQESVVTYTAQLVNQIGVIGALKQGTFDWYVTNENKTAIADDIKIVANADNTATVYVSNDTPVGVYYIVAKSELYPQYVRSCSLVVSGGGFVHSIYVSPDGNDNNPGTIKAPLKTVQEAQSLARQYVAEGKLPLEVVFRGGDYYFEETLEFNSTDSGTEDSIVTYRAYENEVVRFKGSKKLDLAKASQVTDADVLSRIQDEFKTKVRVIDLREQGISESQICTPAEGNGIYKLDYNREFNGFYINGKSMDISCWPNGGDEASYKFKTTDAENKFTYIDDAPDRWGAAKNWWVSIFNSYDYIPLRLKVTTIDTDNNIIYTGNNNGNANTQINNPYTPTWKAYNLLEEIDVPGEYHIDVDNMKIYFLPPCELHGATAEIDVIGNPVITLQDAENITFGGIEFTQINDDGIVMTDVNNVDIEGCTFRDIGFRGLAVLGTQEPKTVQYATGDKFPYGAALGEVPTANDASYNVDVKDNIFYNTGSSAIHINGGNIDTLTSSNNVVENNSISKFAQNSYWDGVVVAGVGITVKNNHISDSPYHGVRIYGNDHIIEYNEIYDVIKNSNDAGAIYVGASPIARGSKIQYNYIHDIKTWKETKNNWEIGIYLDDCQQGITVKNNIITDVHEGILSNGAGDYVIEGNTIVNAQVGIKFGYNDGAVPDSTARTDVANRIYNKDVYYAKYPALKDYVNGISPKTSSSANGNIFYGCGTTTEYYKESFWTGNVSSCAKKYSQDKDAIHNNNDSVGANVFVDSNGKDYRVDSTSASRYTYALNHNFDWEQIGMTTNLTLNAQTAPFGILYPTKGATAVEVDDLWLAWEDAFGASRYRVTVAKDTLFAEVIYSQEVVYTALKLSDYIALDLDTTYYWKVEAINLSKDFGTEWQCEVGKFTTLGTSIENVTFANGTVTADVYTYGSKISKPVNAMFYIAAYGENGSLLEVVPYKTTIEPGRKYPFTNTFEHFNEKQTKLVKIFVWTEEFIPITSTDTIVFQ